MASSSSSSYMGNNNNNKAKELQNKKKQEDGKMESGRREQQRRISMHAIMESDWIKVLRNQKNWVQDEQNYRTTSSISSCNNGVTEEEIEEMELMRIYDFDYVLKNHLLQDEQIVWEYDVWGLQNFHQISTSSHSNHAAAAPNNSSHN